MSAADRYKKLKSSSHLLNSSTRYSISCSAIFMALTASLDMALLGRRRIKRVFGTARGRKGEEELVALDRERERERERMASGEKKVMNSVTLHFFLFPFCFFPFSLLLSPPLSLSLTLSRALADDGPCGECGSS